MRRLARIDETWEVRVDSPCRDVVDDMDEAVRIFQDLFGFHSVEHRVMEGDHRVEMARSDAVPR